MDHLDAFQFSDDDDVDYMPPTSVMKEEFEDQDQDVEPVQEKVARPRPKRRSARSRKQVKTVNTDEYDFDDS